MVAKLAAKQMLPEIFNAFAIGPISEGILRRLSLLHAHNHAAWRPAD